MKKFAFIVALLLISAMFITSCAKQVISPTVQDTPNGQVIEPATDTNQYIDSQIIDPNETIEIGEMV